MIRCTWIRCVDIDVHGIRAFANIIVCLIDADGEPSGNGSDEVAVRAQQKGLRNFRIADAADERAAACVVEGQNAQEILEGPRDAVRSIVLLGVRIAELTRRGDNDVLAGLNINSSIRPKLFANDLNFLGKAPL